MRKMGENFRTLLLPLVLSLTFLWVAALCRTLKRHRHGHCNVRLYKCLASVCPFSAGEKLHPVHPVQCAVAPLTPRVAHAVTQRDFQTGQDSNAVKTMSCRKEGVRLATCTQLLLPEGGGGDLQQLFVRGKILRNFPHSFQRLVAC